MTHPIDLVDLGLAGEERLLGQQLRHDAAQRPHVDGRRVQLGAQQQLGGPVTRKAARFEGACREDDGNARPQGDGEYVLESGPLLSGFVAMC